MSKRPEFDKHGSPLCYCREPAHPMSEAHRVKYDVIYWWQGGRKAGKWREIILSTHPDAPKELLERIGHQGYVAHLGCHSIGPPEGPPTDAEFKALGL